MTRLRAFVFAPRVDRTPAAAGGLTWNRLDGSDPHLAALWGEWRFEVRPMKSGRWLAVAFEGRDQRLLAPDLPVLTAAQVRCEEWFRQLRGDRYY